jgi:hypothetical protein
MTTTSRARDPVALPSGLRRSFDVVAVAALGFVSFLARRGSLPHDGLWFDDSWVAAGAIYGRVSELMTVGSGTPGFTAVLMAVHRLGTGDLRDLGVPSLVAGVAGPMLLYAALRTFGYERSIATIVSAALVVARIPIMYSGRVKGYTLDTVLVLLVAIALPRLAARTWRWPLATAWVVCAVLIGTFSAYTMVAVAGAAIVLVLHPASDRIVRVAAVGAQAGVQLLYFGVSQGKSDLSGIEKVLDRTFDAHVDFSANPITFAREAVTHLRRVAEVFPGGSGGWLTLFGLLAIAGLIGAAVQERRRGETVVARYLLLLIAVAFVGSVLHRFPFGPTNDVGVSAGGRHTLWLVPAIAVGLASVAQRVRLLIAKFEAARLGFDALAVTIAVAIVAAGYRPAPSAPFQGSESGTKFVEASIGRRDVVIITGPSTYSFADSSMTPVDLVATPNHQVGFAPVYRDPRIHVIGPWAVEPGTHADIRSWVQDARRVFVESGGTIGGPGLDFVAQVLKPAGFTMHERQFDIWTVVQVWRRLPGDAHAAG